MKRNATHLLNGGGAEAFPKIDRSEKNLAASLPGSMITGYHIPLLFFPMSHVNIPPSAPLCAVLQTRGLSAQPNSKSPLCLIKPSASLAAIVQANSSPRSTDNYNLDSPGNVLCACSLCRGRHSSNSPSLS